MYVRPEYGGQYWKYEATNVTESQETIVIEHFPLDKNVSYRMKIAGVRNGKESQSSYEFPLIVYNKSEMDGLPEAASPGSTQLVPAEKRRIVKEPPL
ncbi:hypothetical protein KIN20_034848 [Parelaphostrongylus tenuis]|uniref:Uncharacterized protein n=1 Tax=Parelaphostrongylus tenuis TaxID=148309 RepID=A0AAD5RAR4_PARTN|nr:hypothetical protein KIN20_034848 [Parelaphostrongylus tenuis]